jgi:hypothetical protein
MVQLFNGSMVQWFNCSLVQLFSCDSPSESLEEDSEEVGESHGELWRYISGVCLSVHPVKKLTVILLIAPYLAQVCDLC